jgi:hypothetical protein
MSYLEKYHRKNGHGDLFEGFKKRIQVNEAIPVDFKFIHYNQPPESDFILDALKSNNLPITVEEFNELLSRITQNDLERSIQFLNDLYQTNTNDRLRFTLESKEHCSKNQDNGFPNTVYTDDSLTIKIDPQHAYTGVAAYSSHGELSVHPIVLIEEKKLPILGHEVGHGIVGYGHHEPRNCIMDGGAPTTDFCSEDKHRLQRLLL